MKILDSMKFSNTETLLLQISPIFLYLGQLLTFSSRTTPRQSVLTETRYAAVTRASVARR